MAGAIALIIAAAAAVAATATNGATVAFVGAGAIVIGAAALAVAQVTKVNHVPGLETMPGGAAVADDTPLATLPAAVIDTETTGLDVAKDRIVSLGAVRLHGTRLLGHETFDCLIDPGVAIPARSTAIHGITDAMVRAAGSLEDALAAFAGFIGQRVVIGHNLAFDLALLRNGARRAGRSWTDRPWLDTALLIAAFDAELAQRDLGEIAEHLGVDARGRHTALGDALLTAEIFIRLVPRLAERGVTTLGQARAFAATARAALAAQKSAGWWVGA